MPHHIIGALLSTSLEPFLDVSAAAVLEATSRVGQTFAASIYKYQYMARFGVVFESANQQAPCFWKRQYARATHHLRIVPVHSILGCGLGKNMPSYLGARPWNSNLRQINIWSDPVLAKARAPRGSRARAPGGHLGHTRRAPELRRQILARTRPQAAMGTKARAPMGTRARAPGGHLGYGGKS